MGEQTKLRHLKQVANEPGIQDTWCGADRDMWRDTWNRQAATCEECLRAFALARSTRLGDPGDGRR
jgi:hypothetical protein